MKSVLLLSTHKNQFCQCQCLQTTPLCCWHPPGMGLAAGTRPHHTRRAPTLLPKRQQQGTVAVMASGPPRGCKSSPSTARQLPVQKNPGAPSRDL